MIRFVCRHVLKKKNPHRLCRRLILEAALSCEERRDGKSPVHGQAVQPGVGQMGKLPEERLGLHVPHLTPGIASYGDDAAMKVQKATWIEENTGCEACHGPGAEVVSPGTVCWLVQRPLRPSHVDNTNSGLRGQRLVLSRAPESGFQAWDDGTCYPKMACHRRTGLPFRKEYTGDL